ncbi:hypothetical protein QOT17_015610 [Balamuthia mandrillaris]
MSDNNKHGTQHWDNLSPAELCLLIEKEQASIRTPQVNEDETFNHLTATKQELYSAEQHIQELDHTLQQAEQKDPQYLSKQLNSLKLQTSNISFLVKADDFDTLTCLMNNIADRLEHIKLNQWTPYHAADTPFAKHPLFSPSAQPTSLDSPSFSSKILTSLLAYNPEGNNDLEPFLQQLENNLQIVMPQHEEHGPRKIHTRDKHGKWSKVRICIDPGGINPLLTNNKYPIEDTKVLIEQALGLKWATLLDLVWSYNQIMVYSPHQEKLTFIWHGV